MYIYVYAHACLVWWWGWWWCGTGSGGQWDHLCVQSPRVIMTYWVSTGRHKDGALSVNEPSMYMMAMQRSYYDTPSVIILFIASGNNVSPHRHQTITRVNAKLLSIGQLWTILNEIWVTHSNFTDWLHVCFVWMLGQLMVVNILGCQMPGADPGFQVVGGRV